MTNNKLSHPYAKHIMNPVQSGPAQMGGRTDGQTLRLRLKKFKQCMVFLLCSIDKTSIDKLSIDIIPDVPCAQGVCVLPEGLQETPISIEGQPAQSNWDIPHRAYIPHTDQWNIQSITIGMFQGGLQEAMLVANVLPHQEPVGQARPPSRSLQSPRRTR